jgi:DNA-binding XRE family transcriptional regulator
MEFGLYLNSYDKRLREWQQAKTDWKRSEFEHRQAAKRRLEQRQLDAELAKVDVQDTSKMGQTRPEPPPIEVANAAKLANKQARVDATLAFFRDNPMATQAECARQVGVSRGTIGNYLTELEQEEIIHRNGNGVEVLV